VVHCWIFRWYILEGLMIQILYIVGVIISFIGYLLMYGDDEHWVIIDLEDLVTMAFWSIIWFISVPIVGCVWLMSRDFRIKIKKR